MIVENLKSFTKSYRSAVAPYIQNTVTGSTVSTLRGFFAASGMPEIKSVLTE